MQQAPNHLLSWLDHLRILMPPRHVTLVGAGNGSGPWVQWLLSRAVPSATLVEADDALIHPLQATVAAASGAWRVRKQVIGPETATVTFHVASVSSESGLLEPESLRSLWPNLKTRQKQTRQAITLDELLQDDEQSANWLIVDCWPAQPLLQGGQQALAFLDVVILRTHLADNAPAEIDIRSAENILAPIGLSLMESEPGRHPKQGHTLFVRTRHLVNNTSQPDRTGGMARTPSPFVLAKDANRETNQIPNDSQSATARLDSDDGTNRTKVVLDCGGHDGCSAMKLLLKHPDADLISFEPNPTHWPQFKDIPTKLYRSAVHTFNGKIPLRIDETDGDGSSVIPNKKVHYELHEDPASTQTITVQTIDLAELLIDLSKNYTEIILKLDIEGLEYELLSHLQKTNTLRLISKLYCEFHHEKIGISSRSHTQFKREIEATLGHEVEPWDALEFSLTTQSVNACKKIRESLLDSPILKAKAMAMQTQTQNNK